jgi:hypothetical protein
MFNWFKKPEVIDGQRLISHSTDVQESRVYQNFSISVPTNQVLDDIDRKGLEVTLSEAHARLENLIRDINARRTR